MDLSTERAREAFDDEWFDKDILLWTEDGIFYKTAPYRGVWKGFGSDFIIGVGGRLWQGGGSTMHVSPLGIVHVQEHHPLAEAAKRLEGMLEGMGVAA